MADGFGEDKFYQALVVQAKPSGEIIGYALFFYTYSTWDGRAAQLEDIYVQDKYRKLGIGTKLIRAVAKVNIHGQEMVYGQSESRSVYCVFADNPNQRLQQTRPSHSQLEFAILEFLQESRRMRFNCQGRLEFSAIRKGGAG